MKAGESISVLSVSSGSSVDEPQSSYRSANRRVDFVLLPLLFLGFFGLQLDRGNIANAITDTLLEDLNITTDTINTGTQLLSAGIIVFEIPSNMILQKLGPRKWITGQIIVWGLVSSLQCLVQSRSTFLLTRFILGACEAGFIPGALFYLSSWYKRGQYAKVNTIFFLGNQLGTACSGLLASGILRLAGSHSLAGWRWLFLIDGIITIFIGILWLFLLPESPGNPSSILLPQLRLISVETGKRIQQSIMDDDPEKKNSTMRISPKQVRNVLCNWRLWQHIIVSFIPLAATSMSVYFPTIVKQLGYTKYQANAMTSIGWFLAIPFQLALAYYSDYSGHRGIAVIIPQALASIFIGIMFGVSGAKSKFILIVFAQVTFLSFHVLNVTWTSVNCILPIERSISLVAVIMSANLSQLAGAPIFAHKYAPNYRISFIVSISLMCAGSLWSFLVVLSYMWSNRQLLRSEHLDDLAMAQLSDTDVTPRAIQARRRAKGTPYVW